VSAAAAPDTEAGPGPGPLLRRAREARGLTEQQAAEQLNLDVSAVSALERDDLAALGAPVFARGHLRRYGALLGLVEDEVLAAYERTRAQLEAPTLVPRARLDMIPVRGKPKWPWVLGGALLFVLAAGLAAYVSEHGLQWPWGEAEGARSAAAAGPAETQTPASESAPAPPVESAAAASAQPAIGAALAATDPAPLPVPPGHVSVGLAFATDSWAEIYDGSGKPVLYDLGRAGTQRTIAAAAPLSVTLGNAPAVTLSVNGRAAVIPGVPGEGTVARFSIEANGTVR
jgi:cytoskeleton protein RodZ